MIIIALIIIFIGSCGCSTETTTNEEINPIEQIENAMANLFNKLPDDSLLDRSKWRHDYAKEYKKARDKDGRYSPDCCYIDDILSKNLTVGYMDIVISPLLTNKTESCMAQYVRIIFNVDFLLGDIIKLYDNSSSDSQNSSAKLLWETQVSSSDKEFIDSDIFFDADIKYLAEYVRENTEVVLSTNYYHDKPSWMWCLRDKLNMRPLSKLFLPGTHDSGAYTSAQWWQKRLYVTKIYYNYVFTQEDSVFSQLMQGARTLDLRIAKYLNSSTTFFVNHNDFRIHPLKNILDEIVQFIRIHPYEVVVLDCHHFLNGFLSRKDHDELSRFLKYELGDLIFMPSSGHPSWEVSLDDMWQTKGRIIVAYNDHKASVRNNFYPGVNQMWGDKDELKQLEIFMNLILPKNCRETVSRLSCAMAELTPRGLGIVVNKYKGLRNLASLTNSVVTNQFAGSWGIATQAAAVDFIASTGIVTAAILQNVARTQEGHPCH